MTTMEPYQFPRGWMDRPVFSCTREVFDRRSAFMWLVDRANFAPGSVTFGGVTYPLEAGQLVASISFIAKAWMWDACKVRRFLNRLHTDRVIDLAKSNGVTQVTICNYKEIHDPRHTQKSVADTPMRHNRHQTLKSKYNNVDETRGVDEGVQGEKAASGPPTQPPRPDFGPDGIQGDIDVLSRWATETGFDLRHTCAADPVPAPEPPPLADAVPEPPPPVELAAEPITSPAPVVDQPAATVAVVLAAEPISTGPVAVGPPPAGVLIPHEAMERKRAARAERGTRWPAGQPVPAEWIGEAYADRKRFGLPEINLDLEAANFADYWHGKAGAAGLKLDWQATWRKWARSAKGYEHGQGNHRQDGRGNVASRIVNAFGVSGIPR